MTPHRTPEPTSNVPYPTGRTVLVAAATESGPRQAGGPATVLIMLLGVGAVGAVSAAAIAPAA
jgi:hypothetical protein